MPDFGHLFKFTKWKAKPVEADPASIDKSNARMVMDFFESPYRIRLDDRLDALLSLAFDKKELEKAAGIQCVRDFLRRDLDEARRSLNE